MKLGLQKVPNLAAKLDLDFFLLQKLPICTHTRCGARNKESIGGPGTTQQRIHPRSQRSIIGSFSARAAKVKRVIVIFCKVQNLHSLAGKQPKFSNGTRIKGPLSRL
jgi:hypothetical protein